MPLEIEKRVRRRFRVGPWLKWVPALVVLAIWQIGSGTLFDPAFFSAPAAIAARIVHDFVNGTLLGDTYLTFSEIFWGYVVGSLIGGTLGYFSGTSPRVASVVEPYAILVNSVPKIALAPLMIIWFGIGFSSKVAMGAMMVFTIMFFNVFLGVRSINQDYVSLARIMGARGTDLIRSVVLPSIAPYVITGLKQAIIFAMIGAVIAEFIASSAGIGYYILFASGQFDATGVLAGVIVLMLLVMLVTSLLSMVERRFVGWAAPRRR